MQEKENILVRTRLTQSKDKNLRQLAQAQGISAYKLTRKILEEYLSKNSQTTA
jgi:hypothetical protein